MGEARKAEDEARKAELEKRQQEAEAEEMKRVPYEEEMELCEYLSNYLETTYGKHVNHDSQINSDEADISLAGEFEGLVLSGKNAGRDHEDDYPSLNKTTGKKKGRGKKKGGLKINEKIMLVPETIEMFALLELEPPSTINGVSDTVKKLQEKKTWFCTLPRGMFPLSVKSRELMKQSRRHPGVTTVILMKRAVRRHPRHRFEVSRSKVLMPLISLPWTMHSLLSLVQTLKRTPEQPSKPRCLIEPCCCVKAWVYIWRKDQPQLISGPWEFYRLTRQYFYGRDEAETRRQ